MTLALQQTQGGSHFSTLLEQQSKELVRFKRILEEYEKREKQCSRKWTALLQENLLLQE